MHSGDHYGNVHYHHEGAPESSKNRSALNEKNRKRREDIEQVMNSLPFDQMNLRRENIATAHRDTCRWFFATPEYKKWRDVKWMGENHGFLWIKSKPGAGKSTMMSFIARSAEQQFPDDTVVSFFFNARGHKIERSVEGLFRHLLFQLLVKIPRLQPKFCTNDIARLASQGWHLGSLKNLFHRVILDLKSDRLTCLIDALDESSEDEIRDLVDFLEDLGTDTANRHIDFRVCLSSRHFPYTALERCQHFDLDVQTEHHQDIILYVSSKLKVGRGHTADEIKIAVQDRARGVFLWAVLVVGILNKEQNHGNVHKLQELLEKIPDGLHNLFRDIFARDCGHNEHFLPILQWIAFASRPLRREELYFAVRSTLAADDAIRRWDSSAISTHDMDLFILHASKGLAEIITTGINSTVQFIHESVTDYLQETGFNVLKPELSQNLVGLTHEHLKRCCYRRITQHMVQCSEKLDLEVVARTTGRGLTTPSHFCFLEYSIGNIIYHAEQAYTNGIAQIEFLEKFREPAWTRLRQCVNSEMHQVAEASSTTLVLMRHCAR